MEFQSTGRCDMNIKSFTAPSAIALTLTTLMAACGSDIRNAPSPTAAEPPTQTTSPLPSGEYITAGGWGHLQISPRSNGLAFSIESVTGEDYCALKGRVLGNLGVADGESIQPECVVSFERTPQVIEVSTKTPEECKSYCGFNGSFEGAYMRIKDGCGRNDIEQTRTLFQNFYESNNYKAAQAILSPLLKNCLTTLEWEEEGHIRNDLAITQYRNGLSAECLITLEKYAEDARKNDDEVVDGWSPVLADHHLAIVRTARENIGLCSKHAPRNK
jgi:hypothetical protein